MIGEPDGSATDGSSAPVRILILEDDALDYELAEARLARSRIDFALTRVVTRDEFEAELSRSHYDLILADYVLPSFDGISALEIARATVPDVPFIFVSGTLGEEVAIDIKCGWIKNLRHRYPGVCLGERRVRKCIARCV